MTRLTLTPPEAAEALGIGVRTLQDWTADGFVPSIKRGGIRLYSVRALERWADEASVYEEAGSGRRSARLADGIGLPTPFGRAVGGVRPRRQAASRAVRHIGTGGEADAG